MYSESSQVFSSVATELLNFLSKITQKKLDKENQVQTTKYLQN